MSLTVPDSFQWPDDEAAEPIRHGAIVRTKHVKAVCESGHFLRARLRTFLSLGSESIATTSTSYTDVVEEVVIEASAHHSDEVTIDVRGDNTDVRVTIEGTATVTATGSIGSGPATLSTTLNVSTLTGTTWVLKVEHKVPTSGTATIYGLHIRETRHTAATLA